MVRGKRAAMRRGNMLWQRKTAYIEDIEDWVDEPDGSWTYEGYDFNAYITPEKSGEYEFNVEVWFDLQGGGYSRVMTQRVSGAFEDAVFVASDIVEELFDSGVVKGGSRMAGGRRSGGIVASRVRGGAVKLSAFSNWWEAYSLLEDVMDKAFSEGRENDFEYVDSMLGDVYQQYIGDPNMDEAWRRFWEDFLSGDDEDMNEYFQDAWDFYGINPAARAARASMPRRKTGRWDWNSSLKNRHSNVSEKNMMSRRASWSDFNNPVADEMNELYLPSHGEGDTMASQIATAVNKLVYRWFNDGDVFDNVHTGLEGWANDLSSYANWLYTYVNFAQIELHPALGELSENEYESILYGLFMVTLCDENLMENYSEQPAVGSVYNCSGPFEWDDSYGEDEDDWYDDDEDY